MRRIGIATLSIFALGAPASLAADFCVGDSAALALALDIADNNGQSDNIRLQTGTYAGNFVYNANVGETGDLLVEGGYDAACASASADPTLTVLDGGGTGRTLVLSGRDNSAVRLSGVTIQNGLGTITGAGLDVDRWVTALVTNNVFRNNQTAAGSDGAGGAEIDRSVNVTVHDNLFADNNGGKGGGLSVSDMANADIERNRFIDNDATMGGGGLEADTVGALLLANNLFALNTSGEDGGAVDLNLETLGTAGSLQATNNTFVSNSAAEDGGGLDIKMVGDPTSARFDNNLFWANSAGLLGRDMNIDNDDEQNGVASTVILEHNDFDHSFLGFFARIAVAIPASNLNAVNPLFTNMAAGDYTLQAASPVIDAGNSAAAGVGAVDVAGATRVQGANVDLGAFEAGAALDSDGDGVLDSADNCTQVPNADQNDADGDGFGNICDGDFNNDGIVNVIDLGLLRLFFFSSDPVIDLNGDGVVNPLDLGVFRTLFGLPPGPSGLN